MICNCRASVKLFGVATAMGLIAHFGSLAAHAACPQWSIAGDHRIVQSNDTTVDFVFREIGSADKARTIKGGGGFWGPRADNGRVQWFQAKLTGFIDGNYVGFQATWKPYAVGNYQGNIDPLGRISGTGYEQSSPQDLVTWYSRKRATCIASSGSALTVEEEPGTIKAGGRVKTGTPGPATDICEKARRAAKRNSPAAPGLRQKCLEAGEVTLETTDE